MANTDQPGIGLPPNIRPELGQLENTNNIFNNNNGNGPYSIGNRDK